MPISISFCLQEVTEGSSRVGFVSKASTSILSPGRHSSGN